MTIPQRMCLVGVESRKANESEENQPSAPPELTQARHPRSLVSFGTLPSRIRTHTHTYKDSIHEDHDLPGKFRDCHDTGAKVTVQFWTHAVVDSSSNLPQLRASLPSRRQASGKIVGTAGSDSPRTPLNHARLAQY